MTAYGAVVSLKNTIDYTLHSSHFTIVEPSPTIIQRAYNVLQPLQRIVERLDKTRTSRSREKVNEVDGRIKDKIWEFEDKLESLLYQQILPQLPAAKQVDGDGDGGLVESTIRRRGRRRRRIRNVFLSSIASQSLKNDVASFIQDIENMQKEYMNELCNMPQESICTRIGFHFCETKPKMIGLSDQFQQIKARLMGERSGEIYVHEIVGMAGIGKTTLAKELYEDANFMRHFECRAWVTVTRTMVDERPQLNEVVKGIVAQLCGDTLIQGDQNIADYLEGKKCLIVLDDVWETQVLVSLLGPIIEIKMGLVQIVYTTRGINESAQSTTLVRFLNEEESEELLCHKVFGGKEFCPPELDKAATKIAKKCEGLPLMIVTVADILSKSQNTEPDYWNEVAEGRNSVFTDAYKEISKVLYPSYDYLPQYLKMPFLFMGVFPIDYEIPLSKLMNMLNAEGWFLDTNKKKSLKDSVSGCLSQLTSRHQVLFKRKSLQLFTDSIYKTCWLHSSWRYVCREEARKTKLYHALHKLVDSSGEGLVGQRGMCLQNNILFGLKEFCNSVRLNCASFARSLLFVGPYHQYPTPIDVGFRLLRELDAFNLRFYTFPHEILTLVQLKYLALTCNGDLPTTISKLFNLRVLIVHPHMSIRRLGYPAYVPIQIWDMQELEHIEIFGKSLRVPNRVASLEKLTTLVGVNVDIGTILELSKRIPNIRKLGVRVELTPYDDYNNLLSCFACISTLGSLEILKYSIINPVIQYGHIACAPPSSLLMLPYGLRKLHLNGTGFPWGYMDVISCLPSLKVLKLRSYAFRGSNREERQVKMFPRLRFLLIEDSDLVCLDLSSSSLTHLSLKHCYKLEKIIWHLGRKSEWPFRQSIKLKLEDCNPLALTWAKELEPDEGCFLDVTISSSFGKKPMILNFKRNKEYPPLESPYTLNKEWGRFLTSSGKMKLILDFYKENVTSIGASIAHIAAQRMLPPKEEPHGRALVRETTRMGCPRPRVCSWGDLRLQRGRRGSHRDGWRWSSHSRADRGRPRANSNS